MIKVKLREVCKKYNVKNAYQLQKLTGYPPGMAARLWREDWTAANLETLNTLCNLLGCTPNDLLNYTPDKEV